MNRLRGHSLIELIICMSVGTTLLMLGTGALHRTMHFDSTSRRQADAQRTAGRLAHDFRRDAHRAENIRLSEAGQQPVSIRFTVPDAEPVTYELRKGMVLRDQRLDDGQVLREPYYLPTDYHTTFDHAFRPRRAMLTVVYDHGLVGEPFRTMAHVEAEVGRLLRLSTIEEPEP